MFREKDSLMRAMFTLPLETWVGVPRIWPGPGPPDTCLLLFATLLESHEAAPYPQSYYKPWHLHDGCPVPWHLHDGCPGPWISMTDALDPGISVMGALVSQVGTQPMAPREDRQCYPVTAFGNCLRASVTMIVNGS